jgi:hypothetical protein
MMVESVMFDEVEMSEKLKPEKKKSKLVNESRMCWHLLVLISKQQVHATVNDDRLERNRSTAGCSSDN